MKASTVVVSLLIFIMQVSTFAQNKCLYLDGNDDCVRVSDVEEFRFNDFTYEVWVNTSGSVRVGGNIIRHDDFSNTMAKQAGRDFILFRIGPRGEAGFALREAGTALGKGSSTHPLINNQWYYLALVRNAMKNVLTLYVNGSYNSSINLANSHTIDPRDDLYIGAHHEAPNSWTEFFRGKIDELRVWNRALSESEIQANVSRVISGNENGLVLYYNFNELTLDGRVRDLSSYANHGILQGGAHLVNSDIASFSSVVFSTPSKRPIDRGVQDTQPLLLLTSGELSKGKGAAFAGGSSCCNCKIDHYGQLPSDLPMGRVSSVVFYLRGSRKNSYYNRIENGPNTLRLILGNNESKATSEQSSGNELSDKALWILNFKFSPPTPVEPNMDWKLLDGDNDIYSAVLLHSSDIDLGHGIRGSYKTYGCQYSRVENQSYSVMLLYTESQKPLPTPAPRPIAKPSQPLPTPRKIVYKTAVVEFAERGDLGIPDAGAIIAEWITTALNQTGAFEVYERLSLDKLVEEHKLGMTGLLDDETIAEIGRIHGVEAIVHGSVSKFANTISVTAKVIEVETAKLIDSSDTKVNNVDAIPTEIERIAWELAVD